MKLAIISTTIHGEQTYLPFDRLAANSKFSDVFFVIAGDVNSAPFDISKFRCRVEYLKPEDQERFAVSETIGWKTPRRRPIAWLRAIELKPDYILSIDDDNIPSPDYFGQWYEVLTRPVSRMAVPAKEINSHTFPRDVSEGVGIKGEHWHNYLKTSDADIEIYPRGFPIPFRGRHPTVVRETSDVITPERIGLFQGISLGDPDIDAMTRLVYSKSLPVSSVREKNYCLKDVWSPYNMQNTVFSKILFPMPILWPHAGRFDDIYASFAWQKFLFNNGMYVHVGDPVNRQDRGARDTLATDFREEVEGYFHVHRIWAIINRITEKEPTAFMERLMEHGQELGRIEHSLPGGEVIAQAAAFHPIFSRHQWLPQAGESRIIARHNEFFSAYLKDLSRIV